MLPRFGCSGDARDFSRRDGDGDRLRAHRHSFLAFARENLQKPADAARQREHAADLPNDVVGHQARGAESDAQGEQRRPSVGDGSCTLSVEDWLAGFGSCAEVI